jgi:hypothetical protein
MFRHSTWKLLAVSYLTFCLGFLSFQSAALFIPEAENKTEKQRQQTRSGLPDKSSFQLHKEKKLECVPVNKRLKYRHIDTERQSGRGEEQSETKDRIIIPGELSEQKLKLYAEREKLEKILQNKKLEKSEKKKYESRLKDVLEKTDKFEQLDAHRWMEFEYLDQNTDLLHREKCREIK